MLMEKCQMKKKNKINLLKNYNQFKLIMQTKEDKELQLVLKHLGNLTKKKSFKQKLLKKIKK